VFTGSHPDWPASESIGVALAASLLFFGCILLHELAHSLVARRYGLRVGSITLFLFGGVSNLGSAACGWCSWAGSSGAPPRRRFSTWGRRSACGTHRVAEAMNQHADQNAGQLPVLDDHGEFVGVLRCDVARWLEIGWGARDGGARGLLGVGQERRHAS
jgi:hypothetical protein